MPIYPKLAQQGKFRADLLDRLAFDVVNVPPLRHRREDIMPLAEHFAMNVIRELGREFFPGFTDALYAKQLLADRWPGNVRGLKNSVERSVYRSSDPEAPIARIVFRSVRNIVPMCYCRGTRRSNEQRVRQCNRSQSERRASDRSADRSEEPGREPGKTADRSGDAAPAVIASRRPRSSLG